MSKAYFGLARGSCAAHTHTKSIAKGSADQQTEVCDVYVSYDRDANGGEGPDCPMCKVHRLHGNYDKVFVMRVSLSVAAVAVS